MKILKPGKVEMRKFACSDCGCVFAADRTDVRYSVGTDYVVCPFCGNSRNLTWKYGEPYEEPIPGDIREKLIWLIRNFRATNLEAADYEADFLIANGVTLGAESL